MLSIGENRGDLCHVSLQLDGALAVCRALDITSASEFAEAESGLLLVGTGTVTG